MLYVLVNVKHFPLFKSFKRKIFISFTIFIVTFFAFLLHKDFDDFQELFLAFFLCYFGNGSKKCSKTHLTEKYLKQIKTSFNYKVKDLIGNLN